jgi:hypothetical protein
MLVPETSQLLRHCPHSLRNKRHVAQRRDSVRSLVVTSRGSGCYIIIRQCFGFYRSPSNQPLVCRQSERYADGGNRTRDVYSCIKIPNQRRVLKTVISGVTTGWRGLKMLRAQGVGSQSLELKTLKIYLSGKYNYLIIFIYYVFFI